MDIITWRVGKYSRKKEGERFIFECYVTENMDKEDALQRSLFLHNEKSSPYADYFLMKILNGCPVGRSKNGNRFSKVDP
jgi:hypothetical protein